MQDRPRQRQCPRSEHGSAPHVTVLVRDETLRPRRPARRRRGRAPDSALTARQVLAMCCAAQVGAIQSPTVCRWTSGAQHAPSRLGCAARWKPGTGDAGGRAGTRPGRVEESHHVEGWRRGTRAALNEAGALVSRASLYFVGQLAGPSPATPTARCASPTQQASPPWTAHYPAQRGRSQAGQARPEIAQALSPRRSPGAGSQPLVVVVLVADGRSSVIGVPVGVQPGQGLGPGYDAVHQETEHGRCARRSARAARGAGHGPGHTHRPGRAAAHRPWRDHRRGQRDETGANALAGRLAAPGDNGAAGRSR